MPHFPWTRWMIAGLSVAVAIGAATAAEMVGVDGSSVRFPAAIEVPVADKSVRLSLTGAAMRKKAFVSVYAIASYLQDGVTAKTADQLAAANGVKVLVLVMERDVAGKDMADAIRAGIRLNHPADAFAPELARIGQLLQALRLEKGNRVTLTAAPGAGLRCQVAGKADAVIGEPAFARAVWDIYLGRNNVGDAVKSGLVSRR
jgi:spermidine/putrescine-binding protein